MSDRLLEVTYCNDKLFSAYYHLVQEPREEVKSSREFDHGLFVDYDKERRPLGVGITDPCDLTLQDFNALLLRLGHVPIDQEVFAPLGVA